MHTYGVDLQIHTMHTYGVDLQIHTMHTYGVDLQIHTILSSALLEMYEMCVEVMRLEKP